MSEPYYLDGDSFALDTEVEFDDKFDPEFDTLEEKYGEK